MCMIGFLAAVELLTVSLNTGTTPEAQRTRHFEYLVC
jgi:hypothetical protein